jgi:hypothetical protein
MAAFENFATKTYPEIEETLLRAEPLRKRKQQLRIPVCAVLEKEIENQGTGVESAIFSCAQDMIARFVGTTLTR